MFLLQRKYPFDANGYRIRSSVLSAVIVFSLLYVMQPFGFNLYEGNKAAVAAGFGGITFVCHALFSFAGAKLSGRFISKWTILSMSIWLLTMILFIGLCNFFFGIYAYNLGNSNGYQLTLRNCTNIVPVSRTYVPKLKAFIS